MLKLSKSGALIASFFITAALISASVWPLSADVARGNLISVMRSMVWASSNST
jgi:hypothetical protein